MTDQLKFLKEEYILKLKSIPGDTAPKFGKMNVHQMVEHMSYSFKQASGLIPSHPLHDEETTQKMYAFMMSDKPFKANTPNPLLPDVPPTPECHQIVDSISKLEQDIEVFASVFKNENDLRVVNPFFGYLNFQEWIQLLHKHAWHHLRQFDHSTP